MTLMKPDHLKTTDAAMAIENSIAGSILPNYAIIDHNNLVIMESIIWIFSII